MGKEVNCYYWHFFFSIVHGNREEDNPCPGSTVDRVRRVMVLNAALWKKNQKFQPILRSILIILLSHPSFEIFACARFFNSLLLS
ncbi:MAG: hypothetical protein D3909_19745 [Candidatus Electrothrix sp. ATG1]|nr:hypothetical protein [Candidatus Electrothrix sp. ATG1]